VNAFWVPPTLRGYRMTWLGADALAALTLVAVALPSQMATARLADLPAVVGLYAFMAGSLLYFLIGSNPHLSVGADSTIAPVLATAATAVAVVGTAHYATTMAFTALLVGALVIAVGLLRLGWVSEFLSTPVITGVLAGIAVEIVVRQLPVILGVKGGGTTTLGRLRVVWDQIGHTNGWTVGIALGVLALVVVGELVDHRIPAALVGLILSIIAVDAFGLASHHGVTVIGAVHGGLPHIALPSASWSELRLLAPAVLTVTFVCVVQTAATVRASQVGAPATGDFNRDLIGVGAGSVAAGLIGAFAVDASPPNSAIVRASGSRSQLTNLMATVVVLMVVLLATAPLAHLPQATLGATLVFISTKLFRAGQLRTILRFDRVEFALAAATLVVVALVGIEQGVALAIVLSLADRTHRTARPRDAVLGRQPGTDHWIPVDIGEATEKVPGVVVYLMYAPLWYGNADYFRARVRELVGSSTSPVHALVLDANAISDIDYTGLQALKDVEDDLSRKRVAFAIARASHLVHHDLKRGALLRPLAGDHLFTSVDAAVEALKPPKA
jgi:SulP family sulfate permease